MKRAACQLLATVPQKPKLFVVDAMPLPLDIFNGDVIHFIYGEKKSSSIAAASIIAKVTRDEIMRRLDLSFPGYNLAQHKGYSTPHHKQTLKDTQESIIHRATFTDHFINVQDLQESFL